MNKRGCLWIALGVALLLVIIGGAAIVGGGYWVYRQVVLPQAQPVDPAAAAREFEAVRARFAGQGPVFELEKTGDGRATVRFRKDQVPPSSSAGISRIHFLAYDTSKRTLVRFSVPYWLFRYMPNARVTIRENGEPMAGWDRMPLPVEELERIGPALLVDGSDPDRGQVIVWTE